MPLEPEAAPKRLTKQEAARETRMSVRTISYWITSGKVDVVYTVTGKPLIVAASLWGKKRELLANRLRRRQKLIS